MGYRAAAQVLQKAEPLKAKMTAKRHDLLNDTHAWTDQQQLQAIYHQVLVLDLEYALDKKVEQDLWTLGFKNHISALQELTRDKKNPRRSESQSMLSWCLESASGFYLSLLQELCSLYDLELPFRKCAAVFGRLRSFADLATIVPQSSSCLYICQYCLVHLGDIARYRNQRQQAESFYKHAILVSPNSGHPYNQLALLETSQGDKLSTVFQYVRGIAVKNPFPAAVANLTKTLAAHLDKDNPVRVVQTKLSVSEFVGLFLRLHALLGARAADREQARVCLASINATLTALVATQSFSADQLVMLTVVNLYALHRDDDDDDDDMALALLAGSLSAFLLPVYTLKSDASILDYCALPAIRLLLLWIKSKPHHLQDGEFASRLQIWPGYCRLLNNIGEHVDGRYDSDEYAHRPLLPDKELQGFAPLKEAFGQLKFRDAVEPPDVERHLQALRLIALGEWLCTYDVNGSKLIIRNVVDGKSVFEPACIQPDPTDKLLEEMMSFKVAETADVAKLKVSENRKAGILKPQGSLEKAREERQVKMQDEPANLPKIDNVKMKRVTQNVALQSIYKKLEENKQVKFSPEATEKPPPPPPPATKKPLLPAPPSYRVQFPHANGNDGDAFSYAPPPQIPMPGQAAGAGGGGMHYPGANGMFGARPPPPQQQPPPPPPSSMNFGGAMWEKPYVGGGGGGWWPPHAGPGWQQPPPQPPPPDYYMMNANYGQGHHELFGPWGGNRGPNAGGGGNHLMNMRQAMLNETSKHHMMPNNAGASANQNNMNNAPGGYSLFNATAWSPALPQLFGAPPPPQSLQQLLEQQSKLKGDT